MFNFNIQGDGGEDVCCSLEASHLEITSDQEDGKFSAGYIDEFMDKLKMFFVGGLVFPSTHMKRR